MAKRKKKAAKGKRSRFKTGNDALAQLESIEHAQQAARKRKLRVRIDSIEKSEQRLRNSLDRIQNLSDANEEFK